MFPELINNAIAVLLLRAVAGILFFFQGYDKLFNVKIINVVRTFNEPLSKLRIPLIVQKTAITISSIIELICGILLFFGFYKNMALFFLTGDMIFVAFIFSCIKPMWDMQFYFPRLILIISLLLLPEEWDVISLQNLFGW